MADTETQAPDIEGMDDKTFDALKSDMMNGKDVSVKTDAGETTDAEVGDIDAADDLAADDVADDGAPAKQDSVPFGRFERERQRRREVEETRIKERADFEARDRQRQDRLDEILKSFAPKREEPKPFVPPTADENPVEAIAYTAKQIEDIQAGLKKRDESDAAQRQERQFVEQTQQEFSRAVQADPIVADTYAALYQSFQREAQVFFGIKDVNAKDPENVKRLQQANEYLRATEKQHMAYILANKLDMGAYIKGLANARNVQIKAKTADPVTDAANADGVAQIKRASASLANAGGSPARTGTPSPQELLDMSPKQFDEWRTKNPDLRKAFAA